MARALLLSSFLTLVALPAVDGGRHVAQAGRVAEPDSGLIPDDSEPAGGLTREELATEVIPDEEADSGLTPGDPEPDGLTPEEAASLVSQQANSSYTPNTGCQGRVEHTRTIDTTREGCGDRFESQMADPSDGGVRRAQPPHDGWFMVGNGRRRRHRYYCGDSRERTFCGYGNCMKVGYSGRRRWLVTCGECTCHPPAAINSRVCTTLLYSVGLTGSGSTVEESVTWSVGLTRERFQSQDLVREASVSASASMDGVIPQMGGTFGLTAETSMSVMSALHSAYGEVETNAYNRTQVKRVTAMLPEYWYHATASIIFEDGSYASMGGRALVMLPQPINAGCQDIPLNGDWSLTRNAAISGHNREHLTGQTTDGCKAVCIGRSWCKSFDWNKNTNECDLSDMSAADAGGLKTDYAGNPYDHYHCESCR